MKVLHVNAGLEEGGAKTHILSLLSQFPPDTAELLVLEEGPVAKEARLIGVKVYVMDQQSRYDLTVLKRLVDFIKVNQFEVVHTHGARANLLMALIKKRIESTWVVTVHSDIALDFMGKGLKGKVFSALNSWSLKKADKLIAVTEDLKADLVKNKIIKEKIAVVYNGIVFDGRDSVKQPHQIFTLTCIARLESVKAHDFLMDSLKASELSDFRLNLVGDGELRKKLEQKVSELQLDKQIKFHGTLTKEEIEKILQQSDLTVLSSLSEGFPLALLESANQKVPFISTDVGDIARLIPNKSYGWLVPPQDKEAFASALKEAYALWQLGELADKGTKLFELASKEYSLRKMYVDTIAVYENKVSK